MALRRAKAARASGGRHNARSAPMPILARTGCPPHRRHRPDTRTFVRRRDPSAPRSARMSTGSGAGRDRRRIRRRLHRPTSCPTRARRRPRQSPLDGSWSVASGPACRRTRPSRQLRPLTTSGSRNGRMPRSKLRHSHRRRDWSPCKSYPTRDHAGHRRRRSRRRRRRCRWTRPRPARRSSVWPR